MKARYTLIAVAAVSTLLAGAGARTAAASGIDAIDLTNLGTSTTINAVSSGGQFVGQMSVDGTTHAFSWASADGLVDIGVLPGSIASWATAVNNTGEVAGVSMMPSGELYGFVWTKSRGLLGIGTLPGNLRPNAISDTGQVVGMYGVGYPRAFSWTAATGIVDIGTLGGPNANATDVNDRGEVVGWADTRPGETGAFIWTLDGGMLDLGSLGGPGTFGGPLAAAAAINNAGQIVGQSRAASGGMHAFSWTKTGGMVDIAPFASATAVSETGQVIGYLGTGAFSWTAGDGLRTVGVRDTRPSAVSDTGVVVGMTPSDYGWDAFAWTRDGGMTTLADLPGGTFAGAMAVDSHGHIYGFGWLPGEQHALMWSLGDTTPPVIQVPTPISANATGRSGAIVSYAVSANDPDDAVASLTCTPASGGTFPIGTTIVTCNASDTHGNASSADFPITVKGAAEQLADLLRAVTGVGPGTSLRDKIVAARASLAANDAAGTCATLTAFIDEVKAQTDKSIAATDAATLGAAARRIEHVLAC
jgi:probable HAF family extracellular repeat protein